jgi:sterol desaturase/sphingolipid hydroxylase (fatty acid hydroxylase superfamily)
MSGALLLLGLLVGAVIIEALVDRLRRGGLYEARDSELSLGVAIGWAVTGVALSALTYAANNLAYDHRVANFSKLPAAPVAAFLLADLAYYGWHWISHKSAFMWASHFPHHSAKRINFLASVRQGWTDVLTGAWLTWVILAFVGFTPAQMAPYFTALMLVQLMAHNEWVPKLGPLEWVLVTPSNHRVHHSLEARHIDRNYGGVLIVWDRLFGTFADEGPKILHAFGVAGFDSDASSPVGIALHGWRRLWPGRARTPLGAGEEQA